MRKVPSTYRQQATRVAGRLVHDELLAEADRRGHRTQSAAAAAGAGLGALLGSFRGPMGAAAGGLVGAVTGYALGSLR